MQVCRFVGPRTVPAKGKAAAQVPAKGKAAAQGRYQGTWAKTCMFVPRETNLCPTQLNKRPLPSHLSQDVLAKGKAATKLLEPHRGLYPVLCIMYYVL